MLSLIRVRRTHHEPAESLTSGCPGARSDCCQYCYGPSCRGHHEPLAQPEPEPMGRDGLVLAPSQRPAWRPSRGTARGLRRRPATDCFRGDGLWVWPAAVGRPRTDFRVAQGRATESRRVALAAGRTGPTLATHAGARTLARTHARTHARTRSAYARRGTHGVTVPCSAHTHCRTHRRTVTDGDARTSSTTRLRMVSVRTCLTERAEPSR
jgi:hypothetical protein